MIDTEKLKSLAFSPEPDEKAWYSNAHKAFDCSYRRGLCVWLSCYISSLKERALSQGDSIQLPIDRIATAS